MGIGLPLVGVFLLWAAWRIARLGAASVGWPHVEGEVIDSRIVRDSDGVDTLKLRCAYAVQGVSHICSQVAFAGPPPQGQYAASVRQKYPVGKGVPSTTTRQSHPEACWSPGHAT
jgi:hypothetical protein